MRVRCGLLASVVASLVATCDLTPLFEDSAVWNHGCAAFAAAHAQVGFVSSATARGASCTRRGACTWQGFDVWETRLWSGEKGIERVEMFLYNRGDDPTGKGLSPTAFQALQTRLVNALGESLTSLPVAARRRLAPRKWQLSRRWKKGERSVELSWGVSGDSLSQGMIDYVRVALLRGTTTSCQRVRFVPEAHIERSATGDVWLKNVPMVDQGQKGYCAVATAERVLRYYGFAVDEHQLAQAADSDAQDGTEVGKMVEVVKRIGTQKGLGFTVLLELSPQTLPALEREVARYNKVAKSLRRMPLQTDAYWSGGVLDLARLFEAREPEVVFRLAQRDARRQKFFSTVRRAIDGEIPVFWSVTLGLVPESNLPQTTGGHLRLIIGYNERTGEILYSDSWGVGHELKRMDAVHAFAITDRTFCLRPLR